MSSVTLRRALDLGLQVSWVLLLVTLPITNFPFFPPVMGGEALVRPFALYPLMVLLVLAVITQTFKHKLPRTLLPLLAFALFATTSSLLALLRFIPPTAGVFVEERILRALITLSIGMAFFLAVALMPQNIGDLRAALRWVYAGAFLALTWGSLQAVNILHFNQQWFDLLSSLQRYIANRHLFVERISGMTYEPNWFAEQILLLWFPWLFASVLWDYSVFRWRWKRVTIEWLLLGWSILLLPFTSSRAGLLNLAITGFLGMVLFWIHPTQKSPLNDGERTNPDNKKWARNILFILLITMILIAPLYIVGTRSPFLARIWDYWDQADANLSGYLDYLGFTPRLIYSQTAINTFSAHPLLGVGLGNYAFYFEDMLPYRPIAEEPEVLHILTNESGRVRLITAKNLFLRLMAETGMLGTIAFVSFVIAIFGSALYLWLSPSPELRYWGTAGLIGLIAFALSTLTFDSFVFPNMWVLFGLITAATRLSGHSNLEGNAW